MLSVDLNKISEYGKGALITRAKDEAGKEYVVIIFDPAASQGESKSGSSNIVATTSGNVKIGDLTIGLNAYRPK